MNDSESQDGWVGGAEVDLSSSLPQDLPINPWDVVLCVSGTLISCENAIVVAAIFYTPSLRTPMFLLIGSLATADMLAGLGLILHFLFCYCVPSDSVQLATVGLLVASFSASILSLLAITVDRYLSLYNALTYYSERTVTRTYIMLILTWGSSILLGLLPALGWNCLRDGSSFLPSSHYVTTRRGISTLALILGVFASCWLPFAVYGLLGDASYPPIYTYVTLLPATYNSLLNPLIYAFRNQEIQKVLWAACCGCLSPGLSCHSHSPSDV